MVSRKNPRLDAHFLSAKAISVVVKERRNKQSCRDTEMERRSKCKKVVSGGEHSALNQSKKHREMISSIGL